MKIRMLQQIRGTKDGIVVETFEIGQEVELGDAPREADLLKVFLREGWAEEIRARPAPENAAVPMAPENAAAGETAPAQPSIGRRRR